MDHNPGIHTLGHLGTRDVLLRVITSGVYFLVAVHKC